MRAFHGIQKRLAAQDVDVDVVAVLLEVPVQHDGQVVLPDGGGAEEIVGGLRWPGWC